MLLSKHLGNSIVELKVTFLPTTSLDKLFHLSGSQYFFSRNSFFPKNTYMVFIYVCVFMSINVQVIDMFTVKKFRKSR